MKEDYGYMWLKSRMELDLIPGLQMWVDSKLNDGSISEEQANSCRNAINQMKEKAFGSD